MSAHTPGPWRAEPEDFIPGDWKIVANDLVAAHIRGEADARLIAAAPDLLDVVRDVIIRNDRPATPQEVVAARRAYEKALGAEVSA